MNIWFHSTILATSLVATVAVGLASAAIYTEGNAPIAPKTDRLPVTAAAAPADYVTVETRGHGVSVLERVPVEAVSALETVPAGDPISN
ncbi:MAG TPA: hypothetical protein PKA74_12575 [Bauldia sp.]|nr:hypothetical protein [Bauldia sp.]